MAIRRSTVVADAVLSCLECFIDRENDYFVEPYCNGRENGWLIASASVHVAFSEYRNSDQIVLYIGKVGDFEMAGNVPNESVYSKKEFFRFDDFVGAAKRISELLN